MVYVRSQLFSVLLYLSITDYFDVDIYGPFYIDKYLIDGAS
jgi:hypothetical protein